MTPPPEPAGNLAFRLELVERGNVKRDDRLEKAEDLAAKHELELHGELGVYSALSAINRRLGWINTGLWAIALAIIGAAASILFGSG